MPTVAEQLRKLQSQAFAGSMPVPQNIPTMQSMVAPAADIPSTPPVQQAAFDDSAASNLAKITAADNPIMRQARSQGMATANRRGLLNSSMAVGASEAEAYKVAAPLAMAEAQTALQKNVQNTDIAAQMQRLQEQGRIQGGLQAQQSTADMERLIDGTNADAVKQQRDIENQRFLQSGQFGQQTETQKRDIAARMGELTTQLDAQVRMQGTQLSSEEKRQALQLGVQQAMQQAEFANLNTQQKAEIAAQMERLVVSGNQELQRLGTAAGFDQQRIVLQATMDQASQAKGAEQQRALVSLQGEINSYLQAQQDQGAFQRLGAQFAQDLKMQDAQSAARLGEIAASGDQEVRRVIAAAQEDRQKLAMEIAAGDRERIANSAVQIFQAELQIRAYLLNNSQMPASERSAYEQAISTLGNPVRQFVNGLYAQTAPAPAAPTGGGLVPTPAPAPAPAPAATLPPPYTAGGGMMTPEMLEEMRRTYGYYP